LDLKCEKRNEKEIGKHLVFLSGCDDFNDGKQTGKDEESSREGTDSIHPMLEKRESCALVWGRKRQQERDEKLHFQRR